MLVAMLAWRSRTRFARCSRSCLLEVAPGYWDRAGQLRAAILKKKRKAHVADALIAQSCLDQFAPIVTRVATPAFRAGSRPPGLLVGPAGRLSFKPSSALDLISVITNPPRLVYQQGARPARKKSPSTRRC